MKTKKKARSVMPEVHVLGDLEDVKTLVKGVNKKKTVVIFRDGENGLLFTDIEGEIQQVPVDLISNLEKDYRFIYFDFFPGRKTVKSEKKENASATDPALPVETVKKNKKKDSKGTSGKKEKVKKKPLSKLAKKGSA